jgi:hypothetical protein
MRIEPFSLPGVGIDSQCFAVASFKREAVLYRGRVNILAEVRHFTNSSRAFVMLAMAFDMLEADMPNNSSSEIQNGKATPKTFDCARAACMLMSFFSPRRKIYSKEDRTASLVSFKSPSIVTQAKRDKIMSK